MQIHEERGELSPNQRSVFLDTRKHWNELQAVHIERESHWRMTAWGSIAIAIIAVGGMAYQASQNKFIPYVVQVDRLGAAVAVQRADRAASVDARIIRAQLASWIEAVRTVYQDAGAERININSAYAMLRPGDGAFTTLNTYFVKNDPFKRAETEGVTIEISTVLPISEKTWQVQWREVTHSTKGDEISVIPMQANLTVTIQSPTDEATLLHNPMGIYITQFNWSPRL